MDAAAALPLGDAIIDGEMVVQNESGITDFQPLRGAIGGELHRLIFFAFDLLHFERGDLRKRSLDERWASLEALIGSPDPAAAIQYERVPFRGRVT